MLLPYLPDTAQVPDAAVPEAASKPFQILLLRQEEKSGSFRPAANVALTPALRTSGLLLHLPAEELRSLLLLLTFVTPNGDVHPSLLELAQALRQTQARTRARMHRLERFLWQGQPLLHELRRDSGLHAYAPSPRLLDVQQAPDSAPPTNRSPALVAAGREAVIAHSRAAYARPREEVERQIALTNGWEWPPRTLGERQEELRQQAHDANPQLSQEQTQEPSADTLTSSPMHTASPSDPSVKDSQADLRRDLAAWGIPADLIARLLADYDAARIRQQLDWLPYRNAREPGRFLVAALQKDYAPPAAVRNRQAPEQAMQNGIPRRQPDDAPDDPPAAGQP